MEKFIALITICGLAAAINVARGAETPKGPLDFKVKTINDKPADLSDYKGKVVLIVNVASQCGKTPQYKGLEAMYKKYSDKGFVVLGFPANEFGKQEPGTNAEISQFCKEKYSIDFPMFSKIVVKGEGISPLYEYLTSAKTNPEFAGDITWNFEKFLVGRNGKIIARYKPNVEPDSTEVVQAIESELQKKK